MVTPGLTLTGGGAVTLSDSTVNSISSSATATAFTDLDNTISGAGTFGDGNMTVSVGVGGTVNATGSHTLILATGGNTVINAGVLEATGAGGLSVSGGGGVANSGTIWSNGAGLGVAGAVTGTGAGRITGGATLEFGGAVSAGQTIVFDAGATGTLRMDASQSFSGTISGLAKDGSNALDLSDIGFISGTTKATFVGDASGGTLTVTDSTHTALLKLTGDYTGQTWTTSSDGHTGTKIVDPDPPGLGGGVSGPGAGLLGAFLLSAQNAVIPGDLFPWSQGPGMPGSSMPAAGALSSSLPETSSFVFPKPAWPSS